MSWLTIISRRQSLAIDKNTTEMQIVECSTESMMASRNLSTQQAAQQAAEQVELKALDVDAWIEDGGVADTATTSDDTESFYKMTKAGSTEKKINYSSTQYKDYKNWLTEKKEAIQEEYDRMFEELQEEATDKENEISNKQSRFETRLQALNAEADNINSAQQTASQDEAIKLSDG